MTARMAILCALCCVLAPISVALGYRPALLPGPFSDPLTDRELSAVCGASSEDDRAREDWCPQYLQTVLVIAILT